MSAFSKFMKLFSMAGGVRSNIDPFTGRIGNYFDGKFIPEFALPLNPAQTAEAATENSTAINAALSAPGRIILTSTSPTPRINAPIVLQYDDTELYTAPGIVLSNIDGTDKPVLQTIGRTAAGASVTVAWSSGMVATMTWEGHPLSVGDGVVLQGANEGVWRQMLRVVSVTDANTVVVTLRKRVTAGPTGTLSAWRCLRNIKVDVEIDYAWGGATSAAAIDRMATAMFALCDFDIRIKAYNAYKYGLLLCGAIDGKWDVIGDNVSDIAKVYGPASGVVGRVQGVSRDDSFSYQANEPAAYIAYQRFVGPIYDCDTTSATQTQATGASSAAMVLYTDPTHKSDGVRFRGFAHSQLSAGFNVKPGTDWVGAEATCLAGRIDLIDVILAPKPGNYAIAVTTPVEELIIDRPRIEPSDGSTQLIRFESTSTIKKAVIRDWDFVHSSWPSAATQFAINANGNLSNLEISGGNLSGAASYFRVLNLGTGGSINKVTFSGVTIDGGNCVVLVPTGVTSNPTIVLDGCRIANMTNVLVAQSACTLVLRNCDFDTISYIVKGLTNPINIKVVDGGGNKFVSAPLLQALNSSTITVYGQELPVTLSTTGVQKTVRGQFCTSATAVGTIPTGAPVVCDGTNWRALEDRTLVY